MAQGYVAQCQVRDFSPIRLPLQRRVLDRSGDSQPEEGGRGYPGWKVLCPSQREAGLARWEHNVDSLQGKARGQAPPDQIKTGSKGSVQHCTEGLKRVAGSRATAAPLE